jgi:hypothetical protein
MSHYSTMLPTLITCKEMHFLFIGVTTEIQQHNLIPPFSLSRHFSLTHKPPNFPISINPRVWTYSITCNLLPPNIRNSPLNTSVLKLWINTTKASHDTKQQQQQSHHFPNQWTNMQPQIKQFRALLSHLWNYYKYPSHSANSFIKQLTNS